MDLLVVMLPSATMTANNQSGKRRDNKKFERTPYVPPSLPRHVLACHYYGKYTIDSAPSLVPATRYNACEIAWDS